MVKDKTACCGCEACANICPRGIIYMHADEEGFYYPFVKDNNLCTQCGLCKSVCPVSYSDCIESKFTEAYAGWARETSDIVKSSSGAFATIIARKIISNGGVVYGVDYESQFQSVGYKRIDSLDEIDSLRGSKYAQARKRTVFKQIKQDLANNICVLFIGLPCDIYAVQRYIGKNDNLLLVSLICHGPTSIDVHRSYLNQISLKYEQQLIDFSVRYKKDKKWKPYYIRSQFQDGTVALTPFDQTDYNTAFLYFKRPSCSTCHFKNSHFAADILIGDHHAALVGANDYNEHGVSSILPLTKKGKMVMKMVEDSFCYQNVNLANAIMQQAIHSSVVRNIDRKQFVAELREHGLTAACSIPSITKEKNKLRRINTRKKFINKFKRIIRIIKKS